MNQWASRLDVLSSIRAQTWRIAGIGVVAATVGGCAGGGLEQSLRGPVTGSIAQPQTAASTTPETSAQRPSGLAALNPLPALNALAADLAKNAPKPVVEDATMPGVAPQGARAATGRMTEERTVSGSSMALYERLARGVHACFLGGKGPLKGTHIFQGDAKPDTKGGAAEIAIHEKDTSQAFPRGLMVFRIGIEPTLAEMVRIEVSSIRVPSDIAAVMRADVLAWAQGNEGVCQTQVVRPPTPPPPVAAKVAPKKKSTLKKISTPASAPRG